MNGQYDLSRRSVLYTLNGISFREYLNFKHDLKLLEISYQDILEDSLKNSTAIYKVVNQKNLSILSEFKDYLQAGFYPYFLEGGKDI